MQKSKINISMDKDLIDYAKQYASRQRTTISEVFTQFVLNLKRIENEDPTQIILADQEFRDSLLTTMANIRSGKTRWLSYDEVFE